MTTVPETTTSSSARVPATLPKSPGFWKEAWGRFRKKKLSMAALYYVLFLVLVAVFSPAIAGTRPIVCKYKGKIYFPAMGYFKPEWENPIFAKDRFRRVYPENLKTKDPESWAIWPLVYQDPFRRIKENEWPGHPGNPTLEAGQPSWNNLFGTTAEGIDVFARMVHGTRIALLVGFVSMGIASLIGITAGALAGYFGGWVDMVISRVIEVVMCIPTLVLILTLLAIIDRPTIWHLMSIIGATGWTGIARLTRGEFLKLRESDFVAAARVLGAGQFRIIFRHILPNSMAPVLVPITFGIASAILLESGLSFLGFGAPPPNPSWGLLLSDGRSNFSLWWLIVFPGAAIFSAVLAYNVIGEGLQEATDPRLREGGKR
ncbi:ABC transporter permease [Planctomicrobium sp. SH668]|uniref:ABC transporter permease n=1 Tax=Planctomicrobium sp. SH668 TaxID=3448126 RepID=UPI003F5B20B0